VKSTITPSKKARSDSSAAALFLRGPPRFGSALAGLNSLVGSVPVHGIRWLCAYFKNIFFTDLLEGPPDSIKKPFFGITFPLQFPLTSFVFLIANHDPLFCFISKTFIRDSGRFSFPMDLIPSPLSVSHVFLTTPYITFELPRLGWSILFLPVLKKLSRTHKSFSKSSLFSLSPF